MQAIILTGCAAEDVAAIILALMRGRQGSQDTSGADIEEIAKKLAEHIRERSKPGPDITES